MATSKCVACEGTRFEMKEGSINNSAFRLMFVQCASCGGVVGVAEYENTAAMLHELAKKLNVRLS